MELLDRILGKCRRAGAEMAEVYYVSSRSLSISVRNGLVETIEKSTPGGMAIRFFSNGRTAFGHTTEFSDAAIDRTADKLSRLASKMEKDEFAVLPGPTQYSKGPDIFGDSFINEPMETKIQYLINLEKKALTFDPLIKNSQGVSYSEHIVTEGLANSKGVKSDYNSTYYRVGISVVASKDDQMFPGQGSVGARYFWDLPSPDMIVERFASRAVRLIGGTSVEGGDYEIIFAPRAANSILWGLSQALNGDNAFKGASFLTDKKGSKVAAEILSIYDDALMKRGVASRPADSEGCASRKLAPIENGIVTGFMYDSRTAAKASAESTGSCAREDYTSYPGIFPSNFYIAPGTDKVEDVIAACKKGIIVEETQGWGLHNVTGQYSAGINGTLVKDGQRIRPVADVTIAADADKLLNGIGAICDDITFYDSFNSPSIMVMSMRVGA